MYVNGENLVAKSKQECIPVGCVPPAGGGEGTVREEVLSRRREMLSRGREVLSKGREVLSTGLGGAVHDKTGSDIITPPSPFPQLWTE